MPPTEDSVSQSALIEGDHSAPASSSPAEALPETASEMLLRGVRVAKAGQLQEAADIIARSILIEPTSADAHEALATVLLALGHLQYATIAKAKAVGLGYESAADWEQLGDMFSALGQFSDAAQAFETALALNPHALPLQEKLRSLTTVHAAAPAQSRPLFGAEFLNRDQLPPAWQRVNLVTVAPEGNPHVAAFDDLAASFESALKSLGAAVDIRKNVLGRDGVNLLFGAHLIGTQDLADAVPQNTVIMNLEQLSGFRVEARPIYASLLKRLAVWDYSIRNIEALRRLTPNPFVQRVGIGYVPSMTRALPAIDQTTDVLFYGSLNPRRSAILTGLERAGLKVRHLFNVYGSGRDSAIAGAKIVLNMHFYEDSIHEIIRTSYLLANSKAVVAECGPRTEIDEDLREALVAVPYQEIVANCIALANDEPRRRALERRGFEIFARRDQAKLLKESIAATKFPALF